MRVYHVISKLIGQKNDHNWKEFVEISKSVKFGKDRRYEFSKIEILNENLCWRKFPKVFI